MSTPVAVTFDFWNTLLHEQPGQLRGMRVEAWETRLRAAGEPVERVLLEGAIDASWGVFNQAWHDNRQYSARDAVSFVLESLGLVSLTDALREDLVAVFVDVGEEARLEVTPGAVEAITALDAAGVRLGIICDVGMTPSTVLRRHLDRHGLLAAFDHWSFSDEVGAYKPDAVIFAHALEGLGGVRPQDAVHVGDLRRTDIAGALSQGMAAVRYRGVFDDPHVDGLPEGHHVIDDHRRLLEVLDLIA